MRIAILGGAGGMGRVTVGDAAGSEGVEQVLVVDVDGEAAAALAQRLGPRVEARVPAGGDHASLVRALEGADAVVNAASHRLNLPVMRACLEVGAHYTDLGGLYYFAVQQYELDEAFRTAGLSAAISMGAAPGITNMLAAAACEQLDTVETIEVLDAVLAGRGWDPDEPYVPAYAADTLVDEFTQQAPMFVDGAVVLMPAGGGAKVYRLPEGDVECVYTIHSEQATLPRSYADKGVRTVEWRLGLPQAHTLPLRTFAAAGLASTDPVRVGEVEVVPRDVLVAVLGRQSGAADDPGARERLRAHVVGTSGGRRVEIDADLPMVQHEEWGTDSGTYSTGVPPSIAAQMLARGEGLRPGVAGPEAMLPVATFFRELAGRGMHAEISVTRPLA
jgi:saccharopine dehydrogenase-like NADP-dependent oxidoreductase